MGSSVCEELFALNITLFDGIYSPQCSHSTFCSALEERCRSEEARLPKKEVYASKCWQWALSPEVLSHAKPALNSWSCLRRGPQFRSESAVPQWKLQLKLPSCSCISQIPSHPGMPPDSSLISLEMAHGGHKDDETASQLKIVVCALIAHRHSSSISSIYGVTVVAASLPQRVPHALDRPCHMSKSQCSEGHSGQHPAAQGSLLQLPASLCVRSGLVVPYVADLAAYAAPLSDISILD